MVTKSKFAVTYTYAKTYSTDQAMAAEHTTAYDTIIEADSAIKAIKMAIELYKPTSIKITKKVAHD